VVAILGLVAHDEQLMAAESRTVHEFEESGMHFCLAYVTPIDKPLNSLVRLFTARGGEQFPPEIDLGRGVCADS